MPANNSVLQTYDAGMAVNARRVLMLETHSFDDCNRLVWEPILKMLLELSRLEPKSIICLHGPVYTYNRYPTIRGSSIDVDIVGPNKEIAYLGTVIDKGEALAVWKWLLETYRRFPHKILELREDGPRAIIRERTRCSIPVDCETFDIHAVEQGVRRYLQKFMPRLANCLIQWMEREYQDAIEAFIWDEAKRTAMPQTEEEREQVITEDLKKRL